MKILEVKSITDINEGDTIIMTGDDMHEKTLNALVVKVSDTDGTEVIFDRKNNRYFNLGMYLRGESWVKALWVIKTN